MLIAPLICRIRSSQWRNHIGRSSLNIVTSIQRWNKFMTLCTDPIQARNSRSSRRPFDVHTQNLQAVYCVWHRLSYSVQCRYRTNCSSWLNDILRQSTDIDASASSGLTATDTIYIQPKDYWLQPCISRFYGAMLRRARYCYGKLSVCPSVCLSVTLRYCDYIGWKSSKIILWLVSLGCSLFATPTWRVYSMGNTPKFLPE